MLEFGDAHAEVKILLSFTDNSTKKEAGFFDHRGSKVRDVKPVCDAQTTSFSGFITA